MKGSVRIVNDWLMNAVLSRSADGELIRRAGVMATLRASGRVHPGDRITVRQPPGNRRLLLKPV